MLFMMQVYILSSAPSGKALGEKLESNFSVNVAEKEMSLNRTELTDKISNLRFALV